MNFQSLITELIEQMDSASAPFAPEIKTGRNKYQLAQSLGISEASFTPKGRLEQVKPFSIYSDDELPTEEPGADSLQQKLLLDVSYKELTVKLRSESSMGLEVCSLSAQIATLGEMLSIANDKLDQSNRKIGFLEAQIAIQDEQIRQLKFDQVRGSKRKLGSDIRALS